MKKREQNLLEKIENELKILSRDVYTDSIINHHLDYMKNFGKNNFPYHIIKEILNDSAVLESIAKRSYQHVNHFDKIVLINSSDPKDFRLTIHSWNCNYGKEIPDEELIHNHRFSFWSHIYRGHLISENYRETPSFSANKKIFNKFIYKPSETGNIHSCTFESQAQLDKIGTTSQKEGETYFLKYDTIHKILLPELGTKLCTFVLRGPREREYTNTYNTFYPVRGTKSEVPMMTSETLRKKLENIIGEVK